MLGGSRLGQPIRVSARSSSVRAPINRAKRMYAFIEVPSAATPHPRRRQSPHELQLLAARPDDRRHGSQTCGNRRLPHPEAWPIALAVARRERCRSWRAARSTRWTIN